MAIDAVARETVFALRRKIAKIEGTLAERLEAPVEGRARPADRLADHIVIRRDGRHDTALLATGAAGLDRALGGGLPKAGLVEIHDAETRDAGAAAGFILSLASLLMQEKVAEASPAFKAPILWIGTAETLHEAGFPHAAGIATLFGLAPRTLLFCRTRKLADALWVAEEAARLAALSAVVLEIRGPLPFGLTATRRLHMRARETGRPVFLLRHAGQAEPTAAPLRMIVSPAPSALRPTLAGPLARPLADSIGRPAFTVAIDKSRTARPGRFTLEWNPDERAFDERKDPQIRSKDPVPVVSLSGDGAHHAAASGTVLAFPPAAPPAAGRQPAREQRPAHRCPRRTG